MILFITYKLFGFQNKTVMFYIEILSSFRRSALLSSLTSLVTAFPKSKIGSTWYSKKQRRGICPQYPEEKALCWAEAIFLMHTTPNALCSTTLSSICFCNTSYKRFICNSAEMICRAGPFSTWVHMLNCENSSPIQRMVLYILILIIFTS